MSSASSVNPHDGGFNLKGKQTRQYTSDTHTLIQSYAVICTAHTMFHTL